MRDDYTDITVVLDRSGSMGSVKEDIEGGFQGFLDKQAKLKQEIRITLNQFDTEFENVYSGKNIKDVPKFELHPRGMTALLDAIGRSINETGDRLRKMDEKDRPAKVLFVILTDGLENASQEFRDRAKILEMVKRQEEEYLWKFVYIGAQQDAIAEGSSMGFHKGSSLNYTNNSRGTEALFNSLHSYASGVACMTPGEYVLSVKTGKAFTQEDINEQELAKNE